MAGGVSWEPWPAGRLLVAEGRRLPRGFFITFEGPEGGGKSIQSRSLAAFLESQDFAVLWTREPGGTDLGREVRRLLFDFSSVLDPWSEVFLFLADRAQHVATKIRPALEQGFIVICDRFTDSTLAYQGYGRGLPLERLQALNALATGHLKPDLTLLLDVDVETGLRRRRSTEELNNFDRRSLEFHRRVRQGYLHLATQEPERWVLCRADASVDEVQQCIREAVMHRLQSLLQSATSP